MDEFEAQTHSFILKIWSEKVTIDTNQRTWRGHITHVPTGIRRYVEDIDDIASFLAPYFEELGVQTSRSGRIGRWLKHRLKQPKW